MSRLVVRVWVQGHHCFMGSRDDRLGHYLLVIYVAPWRQQ